MSSRRECSSQVHDDSDDDEDSELFRSMYALLVELNRAGSVTWQNPGCAREFTFIRIVTHLT